MMDGLREEKTVDSIVKTARYLNDDVKMGALLNNVSYRGSNL